MIKIINRADARAGLYGKVFEKDCGLMIQWLMNRILLPALFALSLFFLVSYRLFVEGDLRNVDVKPERSYMENVTVTHVSGDAKKFRATIKSVLFSFEENTASLTGIRLASLDKDIVFEAASGIYDVKKNRMELQGETKAVGRDFQARAAGAVWDVGREDLKTKSRVRITSKRLDVGADEMEVIKGEKVRFEGNVRAVFN
jgi:hypothetical protein